MLTLPLVSRILPTVLFAFHAAFAPAQPFPSKPVRFLTTGAGASSGDAAAMAARSERAEKT